MRWRFARSVLALGVAMQLLGVLIGLIGEGHLTPSGYRGLFGAAVAAVCLVLLPRAKSSGGDQKPSP